MEISEIYYPNTLPSFGLVEITGFWVVLLKRGHNLPIMQVANVREDFLKNSLIPFYETCIFFRRRFQRNEGSSWW